MSRWAPSKGPCVSLLMSLGSQDPRCPCSDSIFLCFFSPQTPDEGAWTSVYAAVTPALEGLGGRYLYNERETRSLEATYDPELQRQLWARSCQLTGITDVTRETFGE